MMMKRYILLWAMSLLTVAGMAQQDPLYSQYMFDRLAVNPGFAGTTRIIGGVITHRQYMLDMEGAPVTQKLSFSAPIQSKYMGLGLKVYHDRIGVTNVTSFSGIYAYHIGFAGGKLSFGLEGGLINTAIDFSDLVVTDQGDPVTSNGKESKMTPDASFGIFYTTDKFYLGASAYHLLEGKINVVDHTDNRDPIAHLSRHYFANAGYYIAVNEKIGVEPSVLLKQVMGAPTQFDVNANVIYNDMISAGVSYRTGDAVSAVVKYKLKEKFVFGYSYDMTLSNLSTYSSGAHEIMIGYRHQLLPPAKEKVIDPRYYF